MRINANEPPFSCPNINAAQAYADTIQHSLAAASSHALAVDPPYAELLLRASDAAKRMRIELEEIRRINSELRKYSGDTQNEAIFLDLRIRRCLADTSLTDSQSIAAVYELLHRYALVIGKETLELDA